MPAAPRSPKPATEFLQAALSTHGVEDAGLRRPTDVEQSVHDEKNTTLTELPPSAALSTRGVEDAGLRRHTSEQSVHDEKNTTLTELPPSVWAEAEVRSQVVIHWRKFSRKNSTGTASEWTSAWMMLVALGSYAIACVAYDRSLSESKGSGELQQESSSAALPSAVVQKARLQTWDLIRYFLQLVVIAGHIDSKMYRALDPKMSYWPACVKMNGFMFISGVFGASMEKDSILKMLCYTMGTGTMLTILVALVNLIHDPFTDTDEQTAVTTWYLLVLCGCRLTVTPLFYFCRARGVPVLLPLLLTSSACFVIRAPVEGTSAFPWMLKQFTFFAPFFALGLCLRSSEWNASMHDRGVLCFSCLFTAAYFGGLVFSDSFRNWNDAACIVEGQCTDTAHYPDSVLPPYTLGWGKYVNWHRVLALKASIACTVFCIIGNMVGPLRQISPTVMDNIASLGTRTIYAYVLHWPLIIVLGLKAHLDLFIHAVPDELWPLCCVGMSVVVSAMFACRLTEHLFRWMVLPYWLLDIFGGTSKS